MDFRKPQSAEFVVRAKPFYFAEDGATKVYVPIDNIKSTPVWIAPPLVLESGEYPLTLEPAADGMTCKVKVPPLPDTVTTEQVVLVTYSCDADPGEGVVPLSEEFTVTILPDFATGVEFEEVVE